MDRNERFDMADRIITIGFWMNTLLMIMKLMAGYFGNSEAVFADGIESASDFVAILSAFIALKIGRKPFDEKHPYGHGKAESISAILVSLIIFAAGVGILFKAARTIIVGAYLEPHLIAVFAAFITILIKETLFQFTHRVSNKLGSPAVEAIAQDHRKDALTSIATLIGVGGAYHGILFLDPLAAALTSLFIFHIGWATFRGAICDLMDSQLSEDVLSLITGIAETVPGVERVGDIRGRRSGQYIIIDLKLEMAPDMTLKESHDIVTNVKRMIFLKISNIGDIMILVSPTREHPEDLIRL
ncbi:MAG: cation diffusion facilitator family transporter [Syntrophales bacterium]|jgi:cation diffusion facilitator family transporter